MSCNKSPTSRSVTPYNTGKVKIGLLYLPKQAWSPSRGAYNLQTALISAPVVPSLLSTFFRRFL